MNKPKEVYLQCLECKYTETGKMEKGKPLESSHRFIQIGKKIYHLKVCGEVKVIV